MQPKDREQFDWGLSQPLPGREKKVTEEVAETEGAAFMEMMALNSSMKAGG